MRRYLYLSCFLLLSTVSYATRYHVQASATGNGTGLTWTNAFTDLQEALSVVIPGDEIWVAAGQYKPTAGTSRTIAFTLRNGVNIFGGFAGIETSLEQRDPISNPTVLSGDIGNIGESSDNSHSVVKANNINTAIILDGFRIVNGYSASGSGYKGGGLNVQNALSGNLLLRNCSFVNNYSGSTGGGIYMAAANVTIDHCEFVNNQAGTGGDGGAIYNGNNNGGYSPLEIRDCMFKNNSGRRGAAIFGGLDFDPLVIDRCIFTNNTSSLSIIEIDGFSSASISNSYIIGNAVNGSSTSNVFRIETSAAGEVMTMSNCTIAQNFNLYASPGSEVIRVYGTHHRIVNSIIYGNTAYAGRQVSTGMNISNSIVQGGHANGTDIIDQDPLFEMPSPATATNFDASLFDYTLRSISPGINVGNNDLVDSLSLLDLTGNDRIQGGVVDLGCYESNLFLTTPKGRSANTSWYFDALHNELRISDPANNIPVEILDLSGRTLMRFAMTGNEARIDLPSGAYVARTAGHAPLRFVITHR